MAEGVWVEKQTVQIRYDEDVKCERHTTYTLCDTYKQDVDFAAYVTELYSGTVRVGGIRQYYDPKKMDNAQLVNHFLMTLDADDQKDWLIRWASNDECDEGREEIVYEGIYCTQYTDREWQPELARQPSDIEEEE